MSSGKSMISARCSDTQHAHYIKVAEDLNCDLTQLITASLDVVTSRKYAYGFKSFRVYVMEDNPLHILGVGEVPPLAENGEPISGISSVDLVAPDWYHKKLVSQFSSK